MEIGVSYSNRAAVYLPEAGIPFGIAELIEASVRAEDQGFAYVSFQHSLTAKPRFAVLPLIATIAARTKRIKLNTSILQPLLYNNPVLLAQEIATLDHLSNGRFVPGFGLGTGRDDLVEQELRTVGVDKSTRGLRFAENLEIIKRLLTEDEVTFHGRFYRLEKVRLGLKPVQRPHPPFWIAAAAVVDKGWLTDSPAWKDERLETGTVPAADRVAKYGDGWIVNAVSMSTFRQNLDSIRRVAVDKYGRASAQIKAIKNSSLVVASNAEAAFDELRWGLNLYNQRPVPDEWLRELAIIGSANECVYQLERWAEAGVDVYIANVGLGGGKFTGQSPSAQGETIAREVLPAFA